MRRLELTESFGESLEHLCCLTTEQCKSDESFDWLRKDGDHGAPRDQLVLGDKQAVTWQELIVGGRVGTASDRIPIDGQDLIAPRSRW